MNKEIKQCNRGIEYDENHEPIEILCPEHKKQLENKLRKDYYYSEIMEKEIKQLQKEAREKFEKKFSGGFLYDGMYCELSTEEAKEFQDTLIEQTYNKARKDLMWEALSLMEKKKKK